MKIKKYIGKTLALITAMSVISTIFTGINVDTVNAASTTGSTTPYINYAEALQKSIYFYDANKCGPGITGGRLEWRGDCHVEDCEVPLIPYSKDKTGTNMSQSFIDKNKKFLDPDGNGTLDLHGGFHDAGDHVKFGLPQTYAISTLGWGFYEFRDSYQKINEEDHMIDILKWGNDYLLRSTFLDDKGEVVAFCYQVGEGNEDHNWWQPPELNVKELVPRPAYFATSEEPASDQCAGAAASMAIHYLNFKDTDPEYAEPFLKAAKALYKFAVANRGLGYSGGFYGSSFDEDELSWAAVWLNIATGDQSYIDDIIATSDDGVYTGYMGRIIKNTQNTWQNIWVHCWDTVWGGVFAKLAPITNTERDWYLFRWNLEYWSGIEHADKTDTTFLAKTPAGFSMLNNYGSCRYNAAAQLCAVVYTKYTENMDVTNWAKTQMDYILGDNPLGRSYEVGYSDNYAMHPHHRAAHGSKTLNMDVPEQHRHTLWGALVGGPDSEDQHNDETTDYISNEVAVDYNAAFVGALAGMYKYFGEGMEPLENFPPKEPEEDDFYAEAKLEQENKERTQITVNIHNETSRPPQFVDGLSFKYFFDISELIDAGQTLEDVRVDVMYDEAKANEGKAVTIKGPYMWNEEKNIAYFEADWSGNAFYGDREFHFGLVANLDKDWKPHWDPTNDWSREGITSEYSISKKITVYRNGKLVYGEEPEKSGSEGSDKLLGDLNGDKSIDALDFAAMKKYLLDPSIDIDVEAADMNDDGEINALDLVALKKILLEG